MIETLRKQATQKLFPIENELYISPILCFRQKECVSDYSVLLEERLLLKSIVRIVRAALEVDCSQFRRKSINVDKLLQKITVKIAVLLKQCQVELALACFVDGGPN